MPHISDDEQRQTERMENFASDPDNFNAKLKIGVAVRFNVKGIPGELTLLKIEPKMYAWGGCGNCIGEQATVHISYNLNGKMFVSDMVLSPSPTLKSHGPFTICFGTDGAGAIDISMNIKK